MNALLDPKQVYSLGSLPADVRNEMDKWHNLFLEVKKPITEMLERIAANMGVSYQTARRKYSAWKSGGKMALKNLAKCPDRESVSDEFIEWFKGESEKNQRSTKVQYRRFCEAWARGENFPGLDNSLKRHCHPPGCSYENLTRKIKDAFAKAAMRRGLSFAIGSCGPKVFTTRKHLWFGSHYMIDDLWHDNFVVYRDQLVRVLELDSLDVFSGCKLQWGTKARFKREDGKMDNLKEKYARLVVASTLFNDGFNAERGTTFLAEHGTAAINERIQRILRDRFGLLPGTNKPVVDVARSGIVGVEQVLAGMRGDGKGNPRFKAPLESLRNLIHNELAALPMQTGKDRDHRPEHTHGQLVECSDYMKALVVLREIAPERANLIKLTTLDYHAHFLPLLVSIYDRINRRDWHNLEGWHDLGFITTEYRISPQHAFLTDEEFSLLPAPIRSGVLEAAKGSRDFLQPRKLQPAEVRARLAHTLTHIPPFVVAELLSEDYAREEKVEGAYFKLFSDDEISPEPLRFSSEIFNEEGKREQLKDGKYLVFINPFDPDKLFVHDARQRCLGVALRDEKVDRSDYHAVARAFGEKNRRTANLLQPIRERHKQMVRDHAALVEHNADVIEGKPVTPEEIAIADRRDEAKRARGARAAAALLGETPI